MSFIDDMPGERTVDRDLLIELVDLFGDAELVRISQSELREAVSSFPHLSAFDLVQRCQRLIPELLRHGIWLQRDGLPWLQLARSSEMFAEAQEILYA